MSFIKLYEKLMLEPFAQLAKQIESLETDTLTVLDLGAGSGNYWKTGRLAELVAARNIQVTCLDANYKRNEVNNISFVTGIVPASLDQFTENSFTLVIAFDLLEHLPKSDGYLTLYEMQRICSHASVIFTPNGFSWQPPSDNNKFNAHISSYSTHDFKSFGFDKILGMVSLKQLIGPYSLPKNNTTRVRREIIALFGIFVFKLPKLSYSIFGVFLKAKSHKRINNQEI
jgi:hypothetical protein